MVTACLRLHGAMVLRQVEALLMVWPLWEILWVHLQWEATRWEMLWVVPQWAVLQWVILGLLHLLLMEQWLLWIPQRLRIWLKAWKQPIQLLTPPTLRQLRQRTHARAQPASWLR